MSSNLKKVTPSIVKSWYKLKESESIDTLIKELSEYEHTYDSIVHAITAVSYRAAHAMNNTEVGGISGFQGNAVMWEFIRRWGHYEGPTRLIDYSKMLYPQYKDDFQKTISKETLEWLQDSIRERLKSNPIISKQVNNHWNGILNGKAPFGYKISIE